MTYRIHYQYWDAAHLRRGVDMTDTPADCWYLGVSCRGHDRRCIRITRIERINP